MIKATNVAVIWSDNGDHVYAKLTIEGQTETVQIDVTGEVGAFDTKGEIMASVTTKLNGIGYEVPSDRRSWKVEE